jgi:hypothetical protein
LGTSPHAAWVLPYSCIGKFYFTDNVLLNTLILGVLSGAPPPEYCVTTFTEYSPFANSGIIAITDAGLLVTKTVAFMASSVF